MDGRSPENARDLLIEVGRNLICNPEEPLLTVSHHLKRNAKHLTIAEDHDQTACLPAWAAFFMPIPEVQLQHQASPFLQLLTFHAGSDLAVLQARDDYK